MAITSNVSSFLQVVKQGVRPNMFQVDISFPDTVDADGSLVSYMCKSAVLPAANIGVIEVPFRGRTVKIAGDRTFDNWSATFCLLYTSPSPRDKRQSRMPSSA